MTWMLRISLVLVLAVACFVGPAGAAPAQSRGADGDVRPRSTLYLATWTSYPRDQGNGTVAVFGYSEAVQAVDKITVKITLQKWTGSSWVNVGSVSEAGYNADYVDTTKTIAVQRGCQYRTKSEHQVYHDGVYDPSSPKIYYSSAITVK
ncbi:MAG: hypothetical protein ACOYU7_05125 [Bacillota bacterium]